MPRITRNVLTFFAIEFLLLAGLAALSGYAVPDFSDSNWDTVLFLTPWGIATNLMDKASVIRTFYWDPSPGQTSLTASMLAGMVLIWLGLAANLVVLVRGILGGKRSQ